MKLLLLCILVLFVVSNAKSSLQFKSTDGTYERRYLSVGRWSIAGLWSGAWFRSLEIEGSKPEIDGDYIYGTAYVGLGSYPVCWIGYYEADININYNQTIANNTDLTTFNITTSSSFIVSSYLELIELSSSNQTVDSILLKNMIWTYSLERSAELTNASLGIYAFVVQGKHLIRTVTIEIQYIASEVGGYLDLSQEVLVIPKGVESIIIINDWTYQSTNNFLALRTAVGTLTTSWTSEGTIIAGTGAGKVFYHLASEAYIDGKIQKAELSRQVNTQVEKAFDNAVVEEQLVSRYGRDTSVEVIQVSFPPGAVSIEYDPLMGPGDSPFDSTSPPNQAVVSSPMILLLITNLLVLALTRP